MTDYRGLARESADHGLHVAGDLADSLARKRLRPGLRVGDGLRVVGPARLHRRVAGLLEQITQPGKIIDPQWNVTTITTADGDSIAGFTVTRNDTGITLKIPGGERKQIPAAEIKSVTTAKATLMPDGILENLSAQEAADLLEFLSARK